MLLIKNRKFLSVKLFEREATNYKMIEAFEYEVITALVKFSDDISIVRNIIPAPIFKKNENA